MASSMTALNMPSQNGAAGLSRQRLADSLNALGAAFQTLASTYSPASVRKAAYMVVAIRGMNSVAGSPAASRSSSHSQTKSEQRIFLMRAFSLSFWSASDLLATGLGSLPV